MSWTFNARRRAGGALHQGGLAPELSGLETLAFALAGVFDRFTDLQIGPGHWGEVVLFHGNWGRLCAAIRR